MNAIKIKTYIQKNYHFFLKLTREEQNEVLKYYFKMNPYIFHYFQQLYLNLLFKDNENQKKNIKIISQEKKIINIVPSQQKNTIKENKIKENRISLKHYTISQLILGKRVIIVGPSPSMIGSKMGHFINNFDVVIRLNKSLPLPIKLIDDIGNRTDILYNNLNTSDFKNENNLNLRIFIDANIKLIASPYPCIPPFNVDIQSFLLYNKNIISTHICDLKLYSQVCHQIKTRPNTGIMAIMDVLSHNPSELFICGMTFFKDGYYKEYRKINVNENLNHIERIHKQLPQKLLIRNFYLLDDRINVTSSIKNILLEEFIKICGLFNDINIKYLFFNCKTKAFKHLFQELNKIKFDGNNIWFDNRRFWLYKTKLLKKKGHFIIYNRERGENNILVEDYTRYYNYMDKDSKLFMDEFDNDIILNPKLFNIIKKEIIKIGYNNEFFCIIILLKILFPKCIIEYDNREFWDNLWIKFFNKYN